MGQQIKSFDKFIETNTQNILDMQPDTIVDAQCSDINLDNKNINKTYKLSLQQVALNFPTIEDKFIDKRLIFPNECRLRRLTYAANVQVDITMTEVTTDLTSGDLIEENNMEFPKQLLCRVPIMLKSKYCSLTGENDMDLCGLGECPYDQGGYFIVNGSEKVIVSQEHRAYNHVYVTKKISGSICVFTAQIFSKTKELSGVPKGINVKIKKKSLINFKHFSSITVKIPKIMEDVPLIIVFRSLGLGTDRDVLQTILYDIKSAQNDDEIIHALEATLEYTAEFRSQTEALDYLGGRVNVMNSSIPNNSTRANDASEILDEHFLPHMGTSSEKKREKAFYLGYIVHRLLLVALERKEHDDVDHIANKRLEIAGPLLSKLFGILFKEVIKNTRQKMQKNVNQGKKINPKNIIDSKKITEGIKYSLSTGNWASASAEESPYTRLGVSQMLQRLTYTSTLSHLRRINLESAKNGKITKPRQLHSTQWGVLCPAETPEGHTCGLIKNLALMTYVSLGDYNLSNLFSFLELYKTKRLEEIY